MTLQLATDLALILGVAAAAAACLEGFARLMWWALLKLPNRKPAP